MKRFTFIILIISFLNYFIVSAYDFQSTPESCSKNKTIQLLNHKAPSLYNYNFHSFDKEQGRINAFHQENEIYLPELSEETFEEINKLLQIDFHSFISFSLNQVSILTTKSWIGLDFSNSKSISDASPLFILNNIFRL